MTEPMGRRERKKLRTRQALIDAAMRLFDEKGFDQTLVAEIAELADVSERTFYLHFPTKEDVVLGTAKTRLDVGLRALTQWRPGETVADVLERAAQPIVEDMWYADLPSELAALRVKLLSSTPSVQARLLQRLLRAQGELIEALHQADPDRISQIDAAALVGAVLGAMNAAAIVSLGRGDTPEEVREALRRSIDLALRPQQFVGTVTRGQPGWCQSPAGEAVRGSGSSDWAV